MDADFHQHDAIIRQREPPMSLLFVALESFRIKWNHVLLRKQEPRVMEGSACCPGLLLAQEH